MKALDLVQRIALFSDTVDWDAVRHDAPPADQRLDHLRVDDRTAAADLAQGVEQSAQLTDTVVEQVREARDTVPEQLERVGLVGGPSSVSPVTCGAEP